jgi:Na+-driven multidrug efflux pump
VDPNASAFMLLREKLLIYISRKIGVNNKQHKRKVRVRLFSTYMLSLLFGIFGSIFICQYLQFIDFIISFCQLQIDVEEIEN